MSPNDLVALRPSIATRLRAEARPAATVTALFLRRNAAPAAPRARGSRGHPAAAPSHGLSAPLEPADDLILGGARHDFTAIRVIPSLLRKAIEEALPASVLTLSCAPMGRRRQVSDREISVAAREVFLDRGPKAPVAMVAKKLGVSTATLFQRTGSKQQLMLMAFQPEGTPITELDRGLQPGVPVREQLTHVLIEINQYLGAVISASMTLRAACIAADLPEPTPLRMRAELAGWLTQAADGRTADGHRSPHDRRNPDRHHRVAPHPRLHAAATAVIAAASRLHPRDARRGVSGPLAFRFDATLHRCDQRPRRSHRHSVATMEFE